MPGGGRRHRSRWMETSLRALDGCSVGIVSQQRPVRRATCARHAAATVSTLSRAIFPYYHRAPPTGIAGLNFSALHHTEPGCFMNWDIFVQDLPARIASIAEIPDDFEPSTIGLRSEIIARVSALYPECSFADPSWGALDIPGCSIELNLGTAEDVLRDARTRRRTCAKYHFG